MKKGLLFVPYLKGYGGTETVINNLLSEFDKHNSDVQLKTYSIGGSAEHEWLNHDDVHVISYPKNKYFREFLYIITLPVLIFWYLLKNNPDFVIATNPIIWFLAKKITRLLKKTTKIIAWYHYSYKLKPVKSVFLKNADKYFVISKGGMKELIEQGIDSNKISVIYNPVLPSKKTIHHSDNNNVFVYVGRTEFKNQKNISELFYALAKLPTKNWTLLNYGIGPDKDKLVELSKKLGIEKNIKWMGFKENVFDHINQADALVLTSTFEGFSMVIAEAVSHGLFAISSDCPSGPNELINEKNGLMYNVGDTKVLSEYLRHTLNGKNYINHEVIKNSISKMYIEHYFKRFINNIDNIG